MDTLVKENEHLKAQIQAMGLAHVALQNKLRRLTGKSVDTKFTKPTILEKSSLQLKSQALCIYQFLTYYY